MTVPLALAAGFVVTAVLLVAARDLLARPVLQRENHRGDRLPTAAGLLLVATVMAVDGGRTLLSLAGVGDVAVARPRVLVLLAVVAFGFLGLVDDLLGDGDDRGLRGHVGAALTGRATTGFIKLAGGAAVALVLAAVLDGDRPARVLLDGALIALAANLGNLLDRAPGRTAKWALLAYLPLAVVAGASAAGLALAVVAGGAAALALGDLRERFMLGDAGANALGAALGVGAACALDEGTRTILAGVLLALTLLSEVVSFSTVIQRTPPLRGFDRLGRLPEGER